MGIDAKRRRVRQKRPAEALLLFTRPMLEDVLHDVVPIAVSAERHSLGKDVVEQGLNLFCRTMLQEALYNAATVAVASCSCSTLVALQQLLNDEL